MEEPTELERRLRAAAGAGEWLDLSEAPDKDVPAEFLYAILVEDAASARLRAVKVRGACLIGPLDLEAATLRRPLHLANCEVREPITLSEAIAPAIRLQACTLTGLTANELEMRGDFDLGASRITGGVRLVGAHIGGQLSFSGAQLTNPGGAALTADGLQVDGGIFCKPAAGRPFTATGEVRLVGAHIGDLSFDGATLTNPGGAALRADRLQVDGGMYCRAVDGGRPFTAMGDVRLVGAHIGDLGFNGATLTNERGPALTADRLYVDGAMLCQPVAGRPFTARGEVRLGGAHIGQLSFSGAQLTNPGGAALTADGLHVNGLVTCSPADGRPFTARGEIRLRGAHIGGQLFLALSLGCCPQPQSRSQLSVGGVRGRGRR